MTDNLLTVFQKQCWWPGIICGILSVKSQEADIVWLHSDKTLFKYVLL